MIERILGAIIVIALVTQCVTARADASYSRTLHVMLEFSPSEEDADESVSARRARLGEVADAIDSAAKSPRDRAALIRIAYEESKFSRRIQEYRCADGPRGAHECDSGRATGLWQGHHVKTYDVKKDAKKAISMVRFGLSQCGNMTGAMGWYATGHSCSWAGAKSRAEAIQTLEGRLW